jgi:hypothetical protein
MSRDAVERIRRGYEAFNRGDLTGAAKDFDPNIECGDVPSRTEALEAAGVSE